MQEEIQMSELNGRVALITGASSGIGRVTAGLFAAGGARVMLAGGHGGAIVFLCSDDASYITGTTLTPDGGFTLTV